MRSCPQRSRRGKRLPGALVVAMGLLAWIAGCATVPSPVPATSAPPGSVASPAPTPPERTKSGPAAVRFEPADWAALPGWYSDPLDAVLPALLESCDALLRGRGAAASGSARARTGAAPWAAACAAAGSLPPQADAVALRAWMQEHLRPWQVGLDEVDGSRTEQGLVTGYYEPLLRGSRMPDDRFRYPLHGLPDDLVVVELGDLYPSLRGQRIRGRIEGRRLVPYWSRAQIDAGRASQRGREVLWVDDRMDAFFLEIQGSGRVELPDGTRVRVGYADQNGHPYRAIGRVLVESGELTVEQASMQGIRAWARAHPEKVTALLHSNPSVVFFRETPAPAPRAGRHRPDGPLGALGVPLTALRSVAIDPRVIPLGAPLWLATHDPIAQAPLERLTFAQDTGGAITGALRVDLFWGFGERAALSAGHARERGRLWVLLPRSLDPQAMLDPPAVRAAGPRQP